MPRTHSRRSLLRLGAGLACGALLGGCGDGGDAPGDEPEPDEDEPALTLRARRPAEGAGSEGALRLGTLDPGTGTPADLNGLVFSRLVAVDPRTALIYGDLASSIEVPEPLVLRCALRDGAYFHPDADGVAQPVTAEAIADDFERRRLNGEYLFDAVVRAVEAPSPDSLVLHLAAPFGLLFEFLGSPAASVRSPERSSRAPEDLGSGPFVPVRQSPTSLVLAPHPAYHQPGYPRLAGIGVSTFADERAWAAAFDAGDLDVWEARLPDTPAPGRAGTPVTRASRRLTGLGLSLLPQRGGVAVRHVEAFQDARVRRAVARALDRRALIDIRPGDPSGPVGPAHRADALPPEELLALDLYAHDPADARALLSAAGHEGLAFRVQVPGDDPLLALQAQRLTEQMAEAGVVAQLRPEGQGQWQQAFLAGDFEATLFDIGGLDTPDIGLRLHTGGGVDGRFSPWGYSNPLYDAAVRDALAALAPLDRARAARAAQRLLLADVPGMLPIASTHERAAIAPGVTGFEFDGFEFNASWLGAAWEIAGSG